MFDRVLYLTELIQRARPLLAGGAIGEVAVVSGNGA